MRYAYCDCVFFLNFNSSYASLKVQSYASVQGTIVGTVVESDSDSTSYHPVVEYIVYGKTYSVKGSVGYGRKKEEGSEVEVMFAPNVLIALGASFFFLGAPASYFIYCKPIKSVLNRVI